MKGVAHFSAENLLTEEVSFIMFEFVTVNLWILIVFPVDHVLAHLCLLLFQDTHTVCHYEEIMCTNTHAGYSLGLPVFGEPDASDSLTYSMVIFQTADLSDRTSIGQEINATVSP